MHRRLTDRRILNKFLTNGMSRLAAAWLAQLGERRSGEREVTGSNPGRTNTQGLKITEKESAAFVMTSAND